MRWRLAFPLVLALVTVSPAQADAPEPEVVRPPYVHQARWEDVPLELPQVDDVRLDVFNVMAGLGRTDEFPCLAGIFKHESSWNPDARGDSGKSYGLPQRHAPSWGVPPDPWPVEDQVTWSLEYADGRYGGACEAWSAWQGRAANRGGAGWW